MRLDLPRGTRPQLADRGDLRLDERFTLDRSHFRHGTGVFQYHDVGAQPTLRDLITEMIITSDNTATDFVLMKIGGVEALNAWLRDTGYPSLSMVGRPHQYRRDLLALLNPTFAALTPEETTGLMYAMDGNPLFELYEPLFAGERAGLVAQVRSPDFRQRFAVERNRRTVDDKAFWLGSMTPRDTGRLLEAIQSGTAAAPASCETMRRILLRQQLGVRRLPQFLDVPIGHKTGDSNVIANDVGIVYARSGPIVVAVFTNAVTGMYAETEAAVGRLGQLVVDYFDGRR